MTDGGDLSVEEVHARWHLPITAGRITIRRRRDEDDAAILETLTDPEMARWTSMPERPSTGDLERIFERRAFALIADAATQRPLGGVGVYRWDAGTGTVELGYWVGAASRGRGLATEALRLVTSALMREKQVTRVELLVMSGNVPSERVAENAGYRRVGVLPAHRELRGVRCDMTLFVRERESPSG